MASGHELAIFPGGTESTTEATLLSSMGKEGHRRRLATERKKDAERQLEIARQRKAEQDAKTRLRQEEAARFTDQQRLWWDEEVVHQVAVSRNNFYAEEVRAASPLTRQAPVPAGAAVSRVAHAVLTVLRAHRFALRPRTARRRSHTTRRSRGRRVRLPRWRL